MPIYIEKFLDKAIKLLLDGKGQEFVEWYYEYIQRIFDQDIPLMDIANKAKVPVMPLFLDHPSKRVVFGDAVFMADDYPAAVEKLQEFYNREKEAAKT